MTLTTNYYVRDLVTKQNFNIRTFLFEAFKRTNIFWKLRDENVAGLNKQQFIELIKKNAYNGKTEISAEAFNEMQTEIQAVNEFCQALPNIKLTTQLHCAKVPVPPVFSSVVPKELFSQLPTFDEALNPVREAYYNDPNNPEKLKQYQIVDARRDQYISQVRIAYLNSLTPKQKEAIFKKIQTANISYDQDQVAEMKTARERYREALSLLEKWNPGPKFVSFKEWIIEQIKTGLTYVNTKGYESSIVKFENMTAEQFFANEQSALMRQYRSATATLTNAGKTIK